MLTVGLWRRSNWRLLIGYLQPLASQKLLARPVDALVFSAPREDAQFDSIPLRPFVQKLRMGV